MSDHLSRLAARNLNLVDVVQPRLWSLLEPPSADGGQVFDRHFGSVEGDDVYVSHETESYFPTSGLLSSPLPANRSAESAPSPVGRNEIIGTVRQKSADAQSPPSETTLNQTLPDQDDVQKRPVSKRMEAIPVASNSEIVSLDRLMRETAGTLHRKADNIESTETPLSEITSSQFLPDLNEAKRLLSPNRTKTTTIAASRKTASPDLRQQVPPATTVKTETVGTVRQKSADAQSPPSETTLNQTWHDQDDVQKRPVSKRMEAIPVTSNSEIVSLDRRQPKSSATKIMRETAGTLHRKADDTESTETPLSEITSSQFLPDLNEAKRRPGPKRSEITTVASSSEMHRTESNPSFQKVSGEAPLDRLQQVSPAVTVRAETVRTVRRKAVDVPPPPSETIQSQNIAVTASNVTQNVPSQSAVKVDLGKIGRPATSQALEEVHPPSRNRQLQSSPESDRSPKIGIDGEKRIMPSGGSTEKGLLPAHNSRAAVNAQPETIRFMEPRKENTSRPTQTSPTIKVTIGRVEVRAAAPPAPTSPPQRSAPPSAQKLSLDDYLKQRNGGRL